MRKNVFMKILKLVRNLYQNFKFVIKFDRLVFERNSFQVVTGGNYDVDLELKSPSGKFLYKEAKKQYDQIEQTAAENGVYEFCFSNEFSTISHKVIYIGLQKKNGQKIIEIYLISIQQIGKSMEILNMKYLGQVHGLRKGH